MKLTLFYKKGDKNSQKCFEEFLKISPFKYSEEVCEDSTCIVCFGGDGTVLKSAKVAVESNLPLIAVNTGNLGLLTAYSAENLNDLINDLNNNSVDYEERCVLQASINDKTIIALNEILIERDRTECNEANYISLAINEEQVQTSVCDGIIVATATGSTAYSLSAGGAILHPSVKAFIATTICCHSLNSRPIVFSEDQTATLSLVKSGLPANVFSDGKLVAKINQNERIVIKKHIKTLKIAKNSNFFGTINNKLQNWFNRG